MGGLGGPEGGGASGTAIDSRFVMLPCFFISGFLAYDGVVDEPMDLGNDCPLMGA